MKKNLILLVIILFSCNNYNDKMTAFLEKKAKIEMLLKMAESKEDSFNKIADGMMQKLPPPPPRPRNVEEAIELSYSDEGRRKKNQSILNKNKIKMGSSEYKYNKDSVMKYLNLKTEYISELGKIVYSIDSLSKLK